MLPAEILNFKTNTIVDLVVLPGMDIASIILEATERFNRVFILDTQGDLYSRFSTCGWDTEHTLGTSRISYMFISTIDELYSRINSLVSLSNFALVIDSVTFVCDTSPLGIKSFSSMLWSLVYECGATVVTINHFRVDQQRKILKLVPRMGVYWLKVVGWQVEFTDASDPTKCRPLENRLDQL